jgi:hypothetical protein
MTEGTGGCVGSNFEVCPSLIAVQIKAKHQKDWSLAYETLFAHFCQFLLRFIFFYSYDGIRLQVPCGGSVSPCLKNKTQNIFWNILIQEASAT